MIHRISKIVTFVNPKFLISQEQQEGGKREEVDQYIFIIYIIYILLYINIYILYSFFLLVLFFLSSFLDHEKGAGISDSFFLLFFRFLPPGGLPVHEQDDHLTDQRVDKSD